MISTLKIGPITYSVAIVDELKTPEGDELYGLIQHGLSAINVEGNMERQRQMVTLLHEAIHAILDHAEIEAEERYITATAFGIYGLLRDNPQLVKEITE